MIEQPPIRVLLVEDDEDDFIIAQELFREIRNKRYSVEWISSADLALREIAARKHDVYLIDYRLGDRTGIELCRQARELGIKAPVILLTGQGEPEIDMAAMRAGAEDFLIKGEITARSLERAVRYAIERKRAEAEIDRLAAFPRRNPHPVLEFNCAGTLTYSNDAANALAATLGVSSIAELLPPDVAGVVVECLRTGSNRSLQTARGSRSFAWSFVPIPESQVIHGYASEISERLNLEAQLRHSVKMEAVGQLAAGVAHDFNNILTVIQGHANLLIGPNEADPEKGKPIKQITQAAERAANLIRQLLMFSRRQVMQQRYLDLNEVIHNVTCLLHRLIGEDVALETFEQVGLPSIYADPGMVEQILMNLAVNARDAMPRGGKFVLGTSVQAFDSTAALLNPEARCGEFVCLSVSDTGCGMDPITLNRIFEPFFTTKEVGKGTGLGLATVYGIVKQHQGWIEVESRVGLGTTFRIYLPRSTRPAQVVNQARENEPVAGGNETILVVEDEPALRDLVTEILTVYGYDVIPAESGVHALRLWEEHGDRVDLLLTDMVMPEGVSGRELAERLQKLDPTLKVIYTSGYSPGMAGKDLALLEGFNFLPKPYPPMRLAEVVRESLNSSGAATTASATNAAA